MRLIVHSGKISIMFLFNRPFSLADFFPNTDHVTIHRGVFSFKVAHLHTPTQSFT